MLQAMRIHFRALIGNDKAATAIEYALIASLIAAAISVAVAAVGTNASKLFTNLAGKL
ncbi:Flp family type IVb pilin [Roseospira visakhapatnamensis]|uniref:Flp pilus assembly pilin Flp n=1 Tax=Roseospira visakhapatnamensis TaxID=390880 RepID=A0A7W6RFI8_9PROT|nr:Flp family type IVb pilin [Roseospira visakhapatnamensis]MBB4267563.1 Flp pilus assembly pilin Flp [Roseospira visakhapatnamensis]